MRARRHLEDLDRDIQDHIEHETQDNIERGMSPQEARLAALRKFGNIALVKEDARAVWIPIWVEQLLEDARYGIRMLRRNPGFTAVAVVTLALGIGMNTAIFSVFNAVLLRPLQYPDADRLLWMSTQGRGIPFGMEAVATADYLDWREQATSFESMVTYDAHDLTITTPDNTIRARIAAVADDFWRLSAARAALGRLPQPGERGVMLLSHAFFEQQFQGDPHVVGRGVTVEGRQVMIAGVLPKGFLLQFPPPTWPSFDPKAIDAYRPMILSPQDRVRSGSYGVPTFVVAKLRPGISVERAQAELEAIRGRVAQANPKWFANGAKLRLVPLREKLVGKARPALWVLLGAVVFVLLIACANIASLLLARSSARQKEMAIRASVGAGRGRVLRQSFVESAMLALLGGAGGLLLAHWGLTIMWRLMPDAVPRLVEATIDGRVLAFALGISILTACLFGVGPAIALWTTDLHSALKDGVKTSSASSGSLRTRKALVAVELALAMVLLSGTALMVKSFWRMNGRPPGFDPEHILVVKVGSHSRDVQKERAYATEILHGMQSVPGVQSVSFTTPDARIALNWEGVTYTPEVPLTLAMFNVTSAALPEVIGLRVLKGRWITDTEPALVVAINENLARRDFGSSNPIGKRLRMPGKTASFATVVGVVADLKDSKLDANPEPQLYVPYTHTPALSPVKLLIRTAGDPLAVAPELRKVVSAVDRTQPAYNVMTLERALSDSIAPRRFNLYLLGAFAAAALLLALIGIYGVISYSVERRTHEIGVRMALGAQRGEVVSMVVRQGLGISLAGIVIGMIAATALTRLMESLLYDVKPTDPQTFAAVAFVLSITALAACWIPAHRAALVDPVIALRYE